VSTIVSAKDEVEVDMVAKDSTTRGGEEGAVYQDMWHSVVMDAVGRGALVAREVCLRRFTR